MTSKISFINLRKENIKHRIGNFFVMFLCFGAYFIRFVMNVQNAWLVDKSVKFSTVLKDITALSYPGVALGLVAGFSGAVLALGAFQYLHSRQREDFYDSLPVRRRERLFLLVTNDLLVFGAVMLLVLALKCIVVACIGCLTRTFLLNTAASFICGIFIFLALYLFMALAMLLTGNMLTALLGFGVLSVYFSLIIKNIYPTLAGTFFKTYYNADAWGEWLLYLSPVSTAYKLVQSYEAWSWAEQWIPFVILCVWIILLLAADFWLYEKRRGEMAGKSMAFPKTMPVIRVLLVIPLAVYTGEILYMMAGGERKEWIVVGLILGTMFFHGIIECIYRLDIKGAWSYKKQMLLTMCAAFLLTGYFWLDIGKYDEYVPEASEAESVVINPPSLGSDEEYTYWGKARKGISGETMEKALVTLEKVAAKNDENLEKSNTAADGGAETYYIRYKLKNGQEKTRCYALDKELQAELLQTVFEDEQYRNDTYSLYTADWSWVTGVALSSPAEYRDLDITNRQRAELFRIYLDEFSKLDYGTASGTLPCGQLCIEHHGKEDEYAGIVDYYDIYPSFKKTISYIRDELHVDMKTTLDDIDIDRLEFTEYDEETDGETVYVVTDKEVIRSLKKDMCYGESLWQASTFLKETLLTDSVWAYINTDSGQQQEVSLSITADAAEKLKKNAKISGEE